VRLGTVHRVVHPAARLLHTQPAPLVLRSNPVAISPARGIAPAPAPSPWRVPKCVPRTDATDSSGSHARPRRVTRRHEPQANARYGSERPYRNHELPSGTLPSRPRVHVAWGAAGAHRGRKPWTWVCREAWLVGRTSFSRRFLGSILQMSGVSTTCLRRVPSRRLRPPAAWARNGPF
jgi:hypothetical protein